MPIFAGSQTVSANVLCDSARLEMGVTTRVSRVLGVSGGVFRVFEC